MALRAASKPAPRRGSSPRPQLRVVKGGGKGKRRWSPVPVVVLVVLAAFGVAALQATMSQDGLKTANLEREVQLQTERNSLLRARVAQLSNPGRVAEEARKLGLVGAAVPRHISLEDQPLAPEDRPQAPKDRPQAPSTQ